MMTRTAHGQVWTRQTNPTPHGPKYQWVSPDCSVVVGDHSFASNLRSYEIQTPTGPLRRRDFEEAAKLAVQRHERKLAEARDFLQRWGSTDAG